jgi:hypothetical protein
LNPAARRGTDLLNFQIRRVGAFLLREGLAFEDVFLFDCFFLTDFFGAIPCFSCDFFLGRPELVVFDSFRLLFFLRESMAAVYHLDSPQPRRDQALRQQSALLPLAIHTNAVGRIFD